MSSRLALFCLLGCTVRVGESYPGKLMRRESKKRSLSIEPQGDFKDQNEARMSLVHAASDEAKGSHDSRSFQGPAMDLSAGYVPVAIQPTQGSADGLSIPARSNCPQDQAKLIDFQSLLPVDGPVTDVVLASRKKYIIKSSAIIRSLVISPRSELIFDDKPHLTLTATNITVLSGTVNGALRIGSETCPIVSDGVGITFSGDAKGLFVQGDLEMFGFRYAPTWTRLASTALATSQVLMLKDKVNWKVGQTIAVITTALWDKPELHQNEVRTISAVNGNQVTVSQPLAFNHYGGLEYQAEVALLSRNIVLQGDAASDQANYGGTTKCYGSARCKFSGVQAFRMGQLNRMGSYPFHLHLLGDAGVDSYFQDCVVFKSYFRGFVIHATNKARLSRNVAFDVMGSTYYLEDGVEEFNTFEYNLAALVNIIDPLDYYGWTNQGGVTVNTVPTRIVPSDATAAGFYCTNANNNWTGNSASGGFTGYLFPRLPRPMGDTWKYLPSKQSYVPHTKKILNFDGNTAHSSGRYWHRSSCLYIAGELTEKVPGEHDYTYITGRTSPARSSSMSISNFKAYSCNIGLTFWGSTRFVLEKFESHDVGRSAFVLGSSSINSSVISAQTSNKFNDDLPLLCQGFQFYDTSVQTILYDVEFRNFNRSPNNIRAWNTASLDTSVADDTGISDMCSLDAFRPEAMFSTAKIRWTNTPLARRVRHIFTDASASAYTNALDSDGTLAGQFERATILGSADAASSTSKRSNQWWKSGDDCKLMSDWGFWACPTNDVRTIVTIVPTKWANQTDFPGSDEQEKKGADNTVSLTGRIWHFGSAVDQSGSYVELGRLGYMKTTGPCCDVGWYMTLFDKTSDYKDPPTPSYYSVPAFTLWLQQVPAQSGLVFATSYPKGAQFTIMRCLPTCTAVIQVSTLDEVRGAELGDKYFVDDSGRLFIKLVDPTNGPALSLGTATVLTTNRQNLGYRYTISSTLSGSLNQMPSIPAKL